MTDQSVHDSGGEDTHGEVDTGYEFGAFVTLRFEVVTWCFYVIDERGTVAKSDCGFWMEGLEIGAEAVFRLPPGEYRFVAVGTDEVACAGTEMVELADWEGYLWVIDEMPGTFDPETTTCTLPPSLSGSPAPSAAGRTTPASGVIFGSRD